MSTNGNGETGNDKATSDQETINNSANQSLRVEIKTEIPNLQIDIPKKPNWVEKSTLAVSVLTLVVLTATGAFAGYAAYEAARLVQSGEDTARRQFRAYVIFDGGKVWLSADHKTGFASVTIKNSGITPAYTTVYGRRSVEIDKFPRDIPQQSISDFLPHPVPYALGDESVDIAGGATIELGDPLPFPISTAQLADIRTRKKAIYVTVGISYHDTFGRCQMTNFVAMNAVDDRLPDGGWHLRGYYHEMPLNSAKCAR